MIDLESVDIGGAFKRDPQVGDQERKTRFQICQSCEHLQTSNFCKVCKCFMPIKARVPFFSCPIKKW